MADTFYAWSPIRTGTADKVVTVKMGEQVTKEKLGVSQEDWDAMVEAGSVRTYKVPDMEGFSGSVVEYYQRQARQAAEAAGHEIGLAELKATQQAQEV